jgi:thymidylate kinase
VIVILEGPDGCGKTTLANRLAERFGMRIHHEGPPPKDVNLLEHYGRLLDEARGKNVVFDRLALGERIYGPILRGEDRIGEVGWRLMRRLIDATQAIHVLVIVPFPIAFANWQANHRNELFHKQEIFRRVYERYAQLQQHERDHHVVVDFTRPSTYDALIAVIKSPRNARWLPAGTIGQWDPKYLLVGDQNGRKGPVDLPFWSTNGCSGYLHHCLELAGMREHEIALVNSVNHAGDDNEIIPATEVIALGIKTSNRLTRRSITHRVVPHPQYWMRFHHNKRTEYAALLKGFKA